jgi:hypothetical protein
MQGDQTVHSNKKTTANIKSGFQPSTQQVIVNKTHAVSPLINEHCKSAVEDFWGVTSGSISADLWLR